MPQPASQNLQFIAFLAFLQFFYSPQSDSLLATLGMAIELERARQALESLGWNMQAVSAALSGLIGS